MKGDILRPLDCIVLPLLAFHLSCSGECGAWGCGCGDRAPMARRAMVTSRQRVAGMSCGKRAWTHSAEER